MRRVLRGLPAGPRARRGGPALLLTALVTTGVMLSGCSPSASDRPAAPAPSSATQEQGQTVPVASTFDALPEGDSLVATAKAGRITIHRSPDGPTGKTLSTPADPDRPLVFLVTDEQEGWLKVRLPVRPNGATGWVAEDDVTLSTTPYRLVVSMKKHRLDLFQDGQRTARYPVGVGKSTTPTPPGEYYLAELIQPPDPQGVYGPYAFGLSAYSETLKSFAGGPGQLGLHGTDEPDKVGTDVSHGCLRLKNAVITQLAKTLPLGTPIEIEA